MFRWILLAALISCSSFLPAQKKKESHDHVVTIRTALGNISLLLYDTTHLHKENFLKLAKEGYYNNTTFHRVIKDFMIQGGDPNSKDSLPENDGMGGPGYTIPAEIVPELKHVRGAVAAARMGDQVNPERASSGSQFYIVENHAGTPHLNNAYTVFGQVIDGLEVIDKIAEQPKGIGDRPVKDIRMQMDIKKMKRKKIIKKYHCQDFYKI
jgi:cyclophilin family peptidyl-prolyl cis-trans isomerase